MKRQWLLWAVAIGVIALGLSRSAEILELLQSLSRGRLDWILLAAGLQMLYAVVYAALHQAAFATVGVQSSVGELLPVLFASVFVNVAAPMTGAAGMALFADDAARRGESPTRTAAGNLLVMVADFIAFSVWLALGLVLLWQRGALQAYQLAAAGVLLLMTAGLAGVLWAGARWPQRLRALLAFVQRVLNAAGRLLRRPALLQADWARRNAHEFSAAARAIGARPQRLGQGLLWALAMHLVDVACIAVLFLAFGYHASLDVLLAGYAIGMLFWIVAITPGGLGAVEGAMTLAFVSLGVPPLQSTLVVLAYRGLGFWLPVAIGFFLLRRVRSFGGGEPSPAASPIWSRAGLWALAGTRAALIVGSAILTALASAARTRAPLPRYALRCLALTWIAYGAFCAWSPVLAQASFALHLLRMLRFCAWTALIYAVWRLQSAQRIKQPPQRCFLVAQSVCQLVRQSSTFAPPERRRSRRSTVP